MSNKHLGAMQYNGIRLDRPLAAGMKAKLLLLFFTTATVVMLFISKDSYLHYMFNHFDSAWFFVCGKAWMNGLTPYVDFSDSKGPLLWLIYGVGYLLSPRDYVGVFWLSCVAYTVTLYLNFLTARIFLRDTKTSALVAVTMLNFYLAVFMHNETRCEDFTLPFLSATIWGVCRWLYAPDGSAIRASVLVGVAFGATLMMKFNIAATTVGLGGYVVYAVWRERGSVLAAVGWMALGAAMVVLPFVAYFLVKGCFQAFLYEYFVLTFETTANKAPVQSGLSSMLLPASILALVACGIGVWLFRGVTLRHRNFPAVAFALCYMLSVFNARNYYFAVCMPYALFLLVAVAFWLRLHRLSAIKTFAIGILMAAFVTLTNLIGHDLRNRDFGDFITQDNIARRTFYAYEYLISQVDAPRMVNMNDGAGLGIMSEALPACKYWSLQWGATPQMKQDIMDACRSGKADFAVVNRISTAERKQLKAWGWHEYDYSSDIYDNVLLSKRKLRLTPKKFPGMADAARKRSIE